MRKNRIISITACLLVLFLLCSCTPLSVGSGGEVTYVGTDSIIMGRETSDTKDSEDILPSDTSFESDNGNEGADSSAEEHPEPEEEKKSELRLVMVGDVLMHDPLLESGKTAEGYDFAHIFKNVADPVSKADVAMVNQEVIIAGEEYGIYGYPRFNSPFELADSIADAGFDIVLHATNHTLDRGADAMRDCLDYWSSAHPDIDVVGMNATEEDYNDILVVEKNGIKMAVLNYTYGTNPAGEDALRAEPYLVNTLIESKVRADLRAARASADVTVVTVHWGIEYSTTPSKSQRSWAEIFREEGADIVIGTHPHVLQPVEWIGEGDSRMLVYWSIGNFINSTASSGVGIGERMLGAMADVIIEKDENGVVSIKEAYAVPTVTRLSVGRGGITTYFYEDYTEALHEGNLAAEKDPSFSYSYIKDFFDKLLAGFLPKKDAPTP